GLFSTNTDWPQASPSFCATMRPSVSMVPPAANAMMMRTGRSGEGCAGTGLGRATTALATAAMVTALKLDHMLASPVKTTAALKPGLTHQTYTIDRKRRNRPGIRVVHVGETLRQHLRYDRLDDINGQIRANAQDPKTRRRFAAPNTRTTSRGAVRSE